MKLETYLKFHLKKINRCKRERIIIEFSKSGVKQQWSLMFNNNRLLTDECYTNWNASTYLRSVEKCKTLEDVLTFLYTYSCSHTLVKIVVHTDLFNCPFSKLKNLDDLRKIKINYSTLNGSVYFGSYTITFENGCVSFIRNMPKIIDGQFELTGSRDLIKHTENIVGRLESQLDFLTAVKKLEQL